jgi:hypothetical protein
VIRIVRPVEERWCGVAVLDVVSGTAVEFVRFQGGVQDVFAVQVLRASRPGRVSAGR